MEGTETKIALARIIGISERRYRPTLVCQTRFDCLVFEHTATMLPREHLRWQPTLGSHIELHYHEEPHPDFSDELWTVVTGINPRPAPNRSVQSGVLRCNWDYPEQRELFSDSGQSLIGYVDPLFISGYQRVRDFVSCQVRVGFEADAWGADSESVTILTC